MKRVFLSLGSNVGDRLDYILEAIGYLKGLGEVRGISTLYESPAWGVEEQGDFLNGALEIYTNLRPRELLSELKRIEKAVGRKERFRWGPREIDLDILLYEDLVIESDSLSVPHPYMHLRDFVLVPLIELDGGLIHPKLGLSLGRLLAWTEIRLKPFASLYRVL